MEARYKAALSTLRGMRVVPWARRGIDMVLVTGSGWVVLALIALRLPWSSWWDWIGHLVVTMNVGLLILMPVTALATVMAGTPLALLQIGSVLASFATMLCMQVRRTAHLGLGRSWAPMWAGSLLLASCVSLHVLDLV